MSVEVLGQARTALEATRGTAVSPMTRFLYFEQATHAQEVATITPVDSRGAFTKLYRSYPGVERNSFDISGPVNFDDFTLIGQLGFGSASAGTVIAGTAFSWTFNPSGTADTQRSITMEYSYLDLITTVGWRVPGLVVDELTIKWEKEKNLEYTAKLLTAKGATQITSFTGSLTDRDERTATGPLWSAYLDATTLGTTLDSRIVKAELTVKNGYVIRDGADGTALGIELVKADRRDVQMKLSRYFNDKAELDAYLAKTQRLIRLKTVGGTINGGTALYTHQVDFAGVAVDHKPASIDGLIYADITYAGQYSSQVGGGSDVGLYLVNNINTIT